MIQRVQSIWLFLVAAIMISLLFLPSINEQELLSGLSYNILFKIENGLIALVALITIFFYKDRSIQKKFCFGILFLLIVAFITIFDWYVRVIDVIIPFLAIPVSMMLIILAIRGIKKDQKLISSLDRLR